MAAVLLSPTKNKQTNKRKIEGVVGYLHAFFIWAHQTMLTGQPDPTVGLRTRKKL
jgi:hypothetical protein